MFQHIHVFLPGTSTAAGMARRSIDKLSGKLEGEVLDDLRLLVSELVANSVRHVRTPGKSSIELKIYAIETSHCVHVEVWDTGPGFEPSRKAPAVDGDGGRGLFLVEQISERWGIKQNGGTCVWFDLAA